MRFFISISILILSLVAFAEDKTTSFFTLDHQMSQSCEKNIKSNLRFEKGISKIDISIPDNTIAITFDPQKTNTTNIIKAFKKIGFNAFLINPKDKEKDEGIDCEEEKISNEVQECDCSSGCLTERGNCNYCFDI